MKGAAMCVRAPMWILLAVIFSPAGLFAAETPKEWADLVKAAEAEKQVNIAGPPGDAFRAAISDAFKKAYPRIDVELLGGSGRDKVARILRERQGGVYNWDIYISGPTSALAAFKPVNGFDNFRGMFVLPEVREDKYWIGGHDAGRGGGGEKMYYTFSRRLAGDKNHLHLGNLPPGADHTAAGPLR